MYQKCPICNGTGIVSGGFFDHAGDMETWVSDHAAETCRAGRMQLIQGIVEQYDKQQEGRMSQVQVSVCPKCGVILEYDPSTGCMECPQDKYDTAWIKAGYVVAGWPSVDAKTD